MSTTDAMVPSEVPAPVPTRPRWRARLGVAALILVALVVAGLVVASFVSSGKVGFRPGSADPAEDRVGIEGLTAYTPQGDILFLTVQVDRLSTLEYWWARWFEDDTQIVTEREAFGDQTPQQNRQLNQQLMRRAKDNAELAALEYLGYDAYDTTGARILATTEGTPARDVLTPGDVVVAIDAVNVDSRVALVERLRAKQPGDTVTLTIEPRDGGDRRTVSVTLAARTDGQPGGFLGVTVDDRILEKQLPFTLDIDSGRVGGDSAGLAFALSIIDELTPGELTGGKTIAVTGTISVDGRVGDVGGIPQKVAAARRERAALLLVPAGLADLARQHAGSMPVVGVSTLQQALDALSSVGGNASEVAMSARPASN